MALGNAGCGVGSVSVPGNSTVFEFQCLLVCCFVSIVGLQ